MSKMTKAKLAKFKKFFQKKYTEITRSIKNTDRELDCDGDEVDLVQGAMLSDIANKLSDRDIKALSKLALSLEKIEKGEFGICEDCGEEIGEKRLMALPGVDICINCAEEQERASKQFRNSQ